MENIPSECLHSYSSIRKTIQWILDIKGFHKYEKFLYYYEIDYNKLLTLNSNKKLKEIGIKSWGLRIKLLHKIEENENILRKYSGLYRKKLIDKNDKNCKEGITLSSLQLLDFLSEKKMDFENNLFQNWLTDSVESTKNSEIEKIRKNECSKAIIKQREIAILSFKDSGKRKRIFNNDSNRESIFNDF